MFVCGRAFVRPLKPPWIDGLPGRSHGLVPDEPLASLFVFFCFERFAMMFLASILPAVSARPEALVGRAGVPGQ